MAVESFVSNIRPNRNPLTFSLDYALPAITDLRWQLRLDVNSIPTPVKHNISLETEIKLELQSIVLSIVTIMYC